MRPLRMALVSRRSLRPGVVARPHVQEYVPGDAPSRGSVSPRTQGHSPRFARPFAVFGLGGDSRVRHLLVRHLLVRHLLVRHLLVRHLLAGVGVTA
jgi:hypothetical protein